MTTPPETALDWTAIGHRCAALRKTEKRSRAWVAERAGFHPNTLQNLENGSPMYPKNLEALIKALGVSEAWFKFGEGPIYLEGSEPTVPTSIAEAMWALDWSAADVAAKLPAKLKATPETVDRWASGTAALPPEAAFELAQLLGLPLRPLVKGQPPRLDAVSLQVVRECATLLAQLRNEMVHLDPVKAGEVMVRLCEAHRELKGNLATLQALARAMWI